MSQPQRPLLPLLLPGVAFPAEPCNPTEMIRLTQNSGAAYSPEREGLSQHQPAKEVSLD